MLMRELNIVRRCLFLGVDCGSMGYGDACYYINYPLYVEKNLYGSHVR